MARARAAGAAQGAEEEGAEECGFLRPGREVLRDVARTEFVFRFVSFASQSIFHLLHLFRRFFPALERYLRECRDDTNGTLRPNKKVVGQVVE